MEPTSNTSLIDGNTFTTRLREEAARRLQASQETINGYAQTALQFGVSESFVSRFLGLLQRCFSGICEFFGLSPTATAVPPTPSPAPGSDSPAPLPAPVVASPAVTPPGAPAATNRTRVEGRQ